MNTQILSEEQHTTTLEEIKEIKPFHVIIVYEDYYIGRRARSACDYIVEHLGEGYKPHYNILNFKVLQNLDLTGARDVMASAARNAAEADMVVVAARESTVVPEEVKHWMEMWLRQGRRKTVLFVALLHSDFYGRLSESTPIRTYLENVAARGGLALLCNELSEFDFNVV